MNSKWLEMWPKSTQRGLRRGLSDHCPIIIEEVVKDWGPIPFKSLSAWLDHPCFKDFILERWESYKVQGWGGYVVKEKLKLLKEDLKIWNKEIFGDIDDRIQKRREEIERLDMKDEMQGLDENEVMRRNHER